MMHWKRRLQRCDGVLRSPYGEMTIRTTWRIRTYKNGHPVAAGRLAGVGMPHNVPEHWVGPIPEVGRIGATPPPAAHSPTEKAVSSGYTNLTDKKEGKSKANQGHQS